MHNIRVIATLPDYPTIEFIQRFYPSMSLRKITSLFERIKEVRKEIATEINVKPEGIRDSKGSGSIYIITHPYFEGWIKVGMTNNIIKRLGTYNCSDPLKRFVMPYSKDVLDRREAEKRLINEMTLFASSVNGEWFEIELSKAFDIFNKI